MNDSGKTLPRGFRNNNPLNIRIGNAWIGEVVNPTDTQFEQFTEMVYGLRAGFVLIRRYMERYHLRTIREIVSRWAPASENYTERYIEQVCCITGLQADTILSFGDKSTMCRLVNAMVHVECGEELPYEQIAAAYNMVAALR